MNPRLLTALGVLAILLAGAVYLAFFSDTDYDPVDSPGQGTQVENENDPQNTKAAQEAAADKEPERNELAESKAGAAAKVELDPFYLKSLSGFRGRVVDHKRVPAGNKLVRFYRVDPEAVIQNPGVFQLDDDVANAKPKIEIKETRTAEDGTFQVTGTWSTSIYIYEADAGGENVSRGPVQRAPKPGEIIDMGDIVLQLHGSISGMVVDEEGEPVPDALVRAADIPGQLLDMAPLHRFDVHGAVIIRERNTQLVAEMPQYAKNYFEMLPIPMTRTDANGEFKLIGVMPGMNVVVINTDGRCRQTYKHNLVPYLNKQVKVRPGKEKKLRKIRLKEGEIVEGKVVDEDGKPVPNAEVVVGAKNLLFPADFAYHMGPTNEKGKFSGSGFPPGEVSAAARTRPGEPWVILPPQSVDSDLVIQVPSKYSVTLRLKSALGMPRAKPRFRVSPSNGDSDLLDVATMGMIRWVDVSGRTERMKDGRFVLRDLPKGRYDLAVYVKGHGVGRLMFELNSNAEHEIKLEAMARFQVLVTDEVGKPVRNATIFAEVRRDWRRRKELVHGMPLNVGRTKKNGVLMVENLQPGEIRLSASHPAYGYAHQQIKTPDLNQATIVMQTPGMISGRLTENGGKPKPGKWTVMVEKRRDRNEKRGAMPDVPKMVMPDLEGNFEVGAMRPGRYRLQVVKSLSIMASPGSFINFVLAEQRAGQEVTRKEVNVFAGRKEFVQLEAVKAAEVMSGPHAQVTGVVMMDGRPLSGAMVSGSGGNRWFRKYTDENGRFDLGPVPAGRMRLTVQEQKKLNMFESRSGPQLYNASFEIKDGENRHLQIIVSVGGASGTVYTAGGFPAKRARIEARGVTGAKQKGKPASTHSSSVRTDAQGRFKFDRLPAGTYSFQVRGSQGAGELKNVEITSGLTASGLSLRLKKVYKVSGVVDLSVFGEKKPDWIWISAYGKDASGMSINSSCSVDRDTGKYTLNGMSPGKYSIGMSAHPNPFDRRKDGRLVLPGIEVQNQNITGHRLQPVLEKPKPRKPRPKKKQK